MLILFFLPMGMLKYLMNDQGMSKESSINFIQGNSIVFYVCCIVSLIPTPKVYSIEMVIGHDVSAWFPMLLDVLLRLLLLGTNTVL